MRLCIRTNRILFLALAGFSAVLSVGMFFEPAALAQGAQAVPATMKSVTPMNAAGILESTLVTFEWYPGTGVSQYWLYIGTAEGRKDIYNENQKGNLTVTVAGLPNNGSRIHVRLWSKVEHGWESNDYNYGTCTGCSGAYKLAAITAPSYDKPLNSRTVTFTRDDGERVSGYWLSVGKTLGGHQFYNEDMEQSRTATVSGLPGDGSMIYVRLWSQVADKWFSVDYAYQTCTNCQANGTPAEIISPAKGTTFTSTVVLFKWNAGTNVTLYKLYVGTAAGAQDIYGRTEGRRLSDEVPGIPNNGSTVHVRLWSLIDGIWLYNDYTYIACNKCVGLATMTSPVPGTVLPGSKVIFSWSPGTGASKYKLLVGKAQGDDSYYSAEGMAQSRVVTDLPTDGSLVYVRLSTLLPAVSAPEASDNLFQADPTWQYNDYVYIAYPGLADIADMVSPAPGSTIKGTNSVGVTFSWDEGTKSSGYWLSVGNTLGGKELFDKGLGILLKTEVTLTNDLKPIYVRLWTLIGTVWRYNDYVYLRAAQ